MSIEPDKKVRYPQLETHIFMEMLGAITMMYDSLASTIMVPYPRQEMIQTQVLRCKDLIEKLYEERAKG